MKGGLKGPLPWDIAVFLTVTIVGFAYTVQKFSRTLAAPVETTRAMASLTPEAVGIGARVLEGARGADTKTLDLGCLERREISDRVTVDNVPLRLKGRLCDPAASTKGGAGTLRVRNLSNHTEATIFFRGDGLSFVTDYLPLEAGQNRVQIEWKASAEASESLIVLADVLGER